MLLGMVRAMRRKRSGGGRGKFSAKQERHGYMHKQQGGRGRAGLSFFFRGLVYVDQVTLTPVRSARFQPGRSGDGGASHHKRRIKDQHRRTKLFARS